MTFDHRTSTIHRADLDREIDAIRTEQLIASGGEHRGLATRIRQTAGHLLIAGGTLLVGREASGLRTHRA